MGFNLKAARISEGVLVNCFNFIHTYITNISQEAGTNV
jgi:hypothetical protein